MFQLGQAAEKCKDWDLAIHIYQRTFYPGVRARLIRTFEKNGQSLQALDLLNEALTAPENEAELQQLQRSAPRLQRRLGHKQVGVANPSSVERMDLQLPYPGEAYSVENVVRDFLHRDDAPVFYVENSLINSLFGLLCWKAIFKPVSGAFFHPFHRGPVDLTSVDFYARRQDIFEQCFNQLETGEYATTILQTYVEKQGMQSPFVFWSLLDHTLIDLALTCIPASHLKLWFTRILSDVKLNRNGFPDLIQFWPQEKRYNMIEVKGPGDRLQDNQKRMMEYCLTHQMPIAVCYLEWCEVSL
ncbi:VRR-NUC domain-containing protein [Undibacterium fentianense]